MPPWGNFGSFGGGYREPAPRRLSLEDLLGLDYSPTPRPQPAASVRDLQGEDRRRAQMDSVWAGLAALGGGLTSGRWDRAAAGIGDIAGIQQAAVDDANARAEAEWQEENEARAAELQQQKRQQQAGALLGMYERVVEGEDPGGSFAQRAETAARAGSMAELAGLYGEKGKRAAARAAGYNPDAWDTGDRLSADLKAALERDAAAKAHEGEMQRLREKEEVEREARIAEEEALRAGGYAGYKPPQYEPPEHAAAVAEAQERVRAKYREADGGGMSASDQRTDAAIRARADGYYRNFVATVTAHNDALKAAGETDPTKFKAPGPNIYAKFLEIARREVLGGADAAPASTAPAEPAPQIPGDPHPERPLQQRVADVEAAVGSLTAEERQQAAALLRTMLPRDVVAGIRRARAGG